MFLILLFGIDGQELVVDFCALYGCRLPMPVYILGKR